MTVRSATNRAGLLALVLTSTIQQVQASDLPLPIGAGTSAAMNAPEVAAGVTVPAYSSNPGATYTLYLDFGGFAYTGAWSGKTPGTTPAYTTDSDAATFTASELNNIHNIWSRIAQKYTPFNVNVTTIDPALIAGAAGSDSTRQTYYDATPRLMHTVIGGSGGWTGGGGVSFVNVTQNSYNNNLGYHTNWVFAAQAPSQLQFVAEATAHENGHGLGLRHQSDFTGTTLTNEYSDGTGPLSPIMGVSYYSSRAGLWSKGTINSSGPVIQNDALTIGTRSGMGGFRADGVGHTFATATHLPMTSNIVDYSNAKGIIVPASAADPQPLGASNYTQDHWSFVTLGGATTLTVNSGIATYGTGTADAGAMLDATLVLYNANGTIVQTLDNASLSESLTTSLAAGIYDVAVLSHGGMSDATFTQQRDFFDMGSYFLTGSIRQPLAGDANLDGTVDFNDFLVLQNNFGNTGTNFILGDFNFDAKTDFNDFLALQNNFGQTAIGLSVPPTQSEIAALTAFGQSNIPEPATAAFIGFGLLFIRRRPR